MDIIIQDDYFLLVKYVKETLTLFNVPIDQVEFILDDDAYGRPLQATKQSPTAPYVITINTNLLEKYKNYLQIYLSYPNLFPNIGSANKELIVSSAHFDDNDALFEELQKQEPFYFDEDRSNLYDYLSALLSKILVVHECFHIINGHLDYISNLKQMHFENYGNYEIDLSILDWQTIEMDADCCCVCHIMHEQKRLRALTLGKPLISTDYQFIYSIQLIFLIMLNCEAVNRNLAGYKDKKHPIQSARLILISQTLHDLGYQEETNGSVPEILNGFSTILMKAFGIIQGNLFFGINEDISSYNGEIIRNWKNVRPLLIPYTYAELPA